MDKKVANNLIVGVVVTIGFIAFVFILFNLGGGMSFLSSQYPIYGKFKDVKGLHAGSEVSLAGLRVGIVKEISIASDDSKELIVELRVNRSVRDRIRSDSVASIRTQGVLGDKYIELSIGSSSNDVLEPGSFITTSEAADIFTKGDKLVADIQSKFDEKGEFTELLHNLNLLAKNLNTTLIDVKRNKGLLNALIYGQAGPKLDSAMASLDSIMKRIEKGEGTLGSLINDPTVYEDLKSLMGGAKRSNVLKYFLRGFIEEGAETKKKSE